MMYNDNEYDLGRRGMKISEFYPDVQLEDKEHEFKAKLNKDKPLSWAKTLVGFANNNGGYLFIGVSDDGEAFGVSSREIDETKNLISQVNDRNIFPHIRYESCTESVDKDAEHFLLVVKVYPSDSIVRYREGAFNEIVYVKGDANSVPANPEEIAALSKRKHGVDNSKTEVLYNPQEWSAYNTICREYRKNSDVPSLKELQSAGVISADGYVKNGFLMFKDGYDGGDVSIHCRLWKGKDKSGYTLDRKFFTASISENFLSAIDFLEKNTRIGFRKLPNGGREEIRSYPKEALREALVNAIAHRDYSIYGTQVDVDIYDDRVDITSPGSWILPKKFEDYDKSSIPSIRRNEIIASCFDVANLMERSGSGFTTIFDSYKNYDEKYQPAVLCYAGYFILRLYDVLFDEVFGEKTNIETNDQLSKLTVDQRNIIDKLADGPKGIKELQKNSSYTSRAGFLRGVITPLLELEIIQRNGSEKSKSAVYSLKK